MSTIQDFESVARKNASAFGKAGLTQTLIWLKLGAVRPAGLTANELYAKLPAEYTDSIGEKAFGVLMSQVKSILAHCKSQNIDPLEFCKATGGIGKMLAVVKPKSEEKTAPEAVKAEGKSKVEGKGGDYVVNLADQAKIVFDQACSVVRNMNDRDLAELAKVVAAELQRRQAVKAA